MPRLKNGRFTKAGTKARVEKLAAITATNKQKRQIAKAAEMMMKEDEPTMLVPAGRRIIELDTVARGLWCKPCNRPLSMLFLEEETQLGLCSLWRIRCDVCLYLYEVPTSKKVPNPKGVHSPYASNCKAAPACIDCGIGPEVLKKLLSVLNIPVLHRNTYQRAHDVISEYVVQTADKSCQNAIDLEKRLALELLVEQGVRASDASAGVTLDELKDVMLTKGTVGFGPCVGVQINRKPRVTSNKEIVAKIALCVRQMLEKSGVDLPHLW